MMYAVVQNDKPPHDWQVFDVYGTLISSGWDSYDDAMVEVRRLKLRDSIQEDDTRRQDVLRVIEEEADQARKARDEEAREWRERLDEEARERREQSDDEDGHRPCFGP